MQPFLGELRVFSYNFVPRGWLACNGALLSISQNSALFALIGTQFGGNGTTTFGLPDLRGSVPVGQGNAPGGTYVMGQFSGQETVSLSIATMPAHNHLLKAQTVTGTVQLNPAAPAEILAPGARNLVPDVINMYSNSNAGLTALTGNTIGANGSGTAHENMPPFLPLNICIATAGIFPSRN
ncbi:phage tail protein [Mucilaginibacter sp. E4BP6]|uniref:phage tail protein n=1 Tax=Mucilaginibacter sp. E4BP6 TaxID=2723089 RepID=UPI0015C858EF|nr:tail fiber protein [Mucilaginibacter sp. E4BP6]NYE65519.1 microcystin-dependent protein [Mucilaginibacter sp. E4BP6]